MAHQKRNPTPALGDCLIGLSVKADQLTLGLDRDAKCSKDVFMDFLVKDLMLM